MKRRLFFYGIGTLLVSLIIAAIAWLYCARMAVASKDTPDKAPAATETADATVQPKPTVTQPDPEPVVEPEPVIVPEPVPEPAVIPQPEPSVELHEDPDLPVIIESLAKPTIIQQNPLIMAAEKGDSDTVQQLVASGADINVQDVAGYTPLIAAIVAGKLELIPLLLELKADPNKADTIGASPLMHAAYLGQTATVQQLLSAGADKTKRDVMGNPAINYATEKQHAEVINLLAD